jgi:hypothetical protein
MKPPQLVTGPNRKLTSPNAALMRNFAVCSNERKTKSPSPNAGRG